MGVNKGVIINPDIIVGKIHRLNMQIANLNVRIKHLYDLNDRIYNLNYRGEHKQIIDKYIEEALEYYRLCRRYYELQVRIIKNISQQFKAVDESMTDMIGVNYEL